VTIIVGTGVLIQASSTKIPAMNLNGLPSGSTIQLRNKGFICGKGGNGGDGAELMGSNGSGGLTLQKAAVNGEAGGKAIFGPGTGVTLQINNSGGYIWGGGGGGGAAGVSITVGGSFSYAYANGGGGGAGAGNAKGGKGGRAGYGASELFADNGGDSGSGVDGTYGAGGSSRGANSGGGNGQGTAGRGGDFGEAGVAGTGNTTYGAVAVASTGGAAGKAIDFNGGTVTVSLGAGSPNIKGATS
jgi:hypothetical protein